MGLLRIRDNPLKKKKKKLTKADQAAVESYKKLLDKWEKVPKFARQHTVSKQELKQQTLEVEFQQRDRPKPKLDAGSTSPPKQQIYTGTKMIGLATMHKSSIVPVFSQQEAIDIAKMRRG